MLKHVIAAMACGLCAAAFLAQTLWFGERHSLTFDETIYLNLSMRSVRDWRLDPEFMAFGIAPLPALITYVPAIAANEGDLRVASETWEGRLDAPALIRAPRLLNSLLVGVPLIVTIFWWLYRRRGLTAATLGGGLAALSPTIVANGALATTDLSVAFFGTVGMASIAWFASRPTASRMLVCAVAVAAAMSAKYSGLFLLPVAGGVFVLASIRRQQRDGGAVLTRKLLRESVQHVALLGVLVLPLWWAGHLFSRVTSEDTSVSSSGLVSSTTVSPNSFPDFAMTLAPIVGLRHQLAHNAMGGDAFLMGERSSGSGWWYYFPLVFLFKSTPAELALAAFLLLAVVLALRRPWSALVQLDPAMLCMLLAAVVFSGLLVTSHLNQGHRYMLPLYPILIVAACDRLALRLGHRRAALAGLAAVLLAVQAWSSLGIGPHYLAYVNRLAGGPGNGWRLMADSSLDWGQDLPELRSYLDARPDQLTAMKYFGTALPDAYGVKADEVEHLKGRPEDYDVLALSATFLNGLHMSGRDPFREFRKLEPDSQLGYSIMIYNLRRPEALSAFREALKTIPH